MARRVVIADDDVLLREGVSSLLAGAGYDVVGQAGDGDALNEIVRDQVPDLVLIDIRMPPTQTRKGRDAARSIRRELAEIGIVLLSAHLEVETAMAADCLIVISPRRRHDVGSALIRITGLARRRPLPRLPR